MTETIRSRRRLWPRGPRGWVRWALLEPLLLVMRHYLGNAVRNEYLGRLLLLNLLQSWESRLLDGMFTPRMTSHGYLFSGPRDMVEGRFEPAVTRVVARLAAVHETFVDVGAHVGYYTCLARTNGCSVVAVEPDPLSVHHLLRNVRDNGGPDVRVHPVAVGPAVGVGALYGSALCTSLVPGWADAGPRARHLVELRPLAEVVPPGAGTILIKLDVEGYEYATLTGAEALLDATPAPCWIVENCPTEPNPGGHNPYFCRLFELFFDHGYDAWEITGTDRPGLVPVTAERVRRWGERGAADVATYNYLFARAGGCGGVLADLVLPEP